MMKKTLKIKKKKEKKKNRKKEEKLKKWKKWKKKLTNDIDVVVKEFILQENDTEMYINMKKNILSHKINIESDGSHQIEHKKWPTKFFHFQ